MINYNVSGKQRKALVKKIEAITGERSVYQGAPSMAFRVGEYIISTKGEVTPDLPEDVIDKLARAGFSPVSKEDESEGFVITISRDTVSDVAIENFRNMLSSKGALIKKSLGITSLPINVTDNEVIIRWFEGQDDVDEELVSRLISAMIGKAEVQKYVSAKPLETDNEKYSFRIFLNSLGFTGGENKEIRQKLLNNLDGSSAFRHPAKGTRIERRSAV